MKYIACLLLILACSCAHRQTDRSDTVVSMQIIDRNGFTETISNHDRISSFRDTNFSSAQPFQKVLRVYGKNKEGKTTSKITTYHDNGLLYQYLEAVDGRSHGAYKEWFPNGTLRIDATLIEGVADITDLAQNTWVFDNDCTIWDSEGNRKALFHYQKGILTGQALTFFPNGDIETITPYDQGHIHGTVQIFSIDRTLIEQIHYQKNLKEGPAAAYWNNEQPKFKEEYIQGKLQSATYWDLTGNICATVQEGQGESALFDGPTLTTLLSIQEGVIEGKISEFNPDGTLKNIYHLHEGKKEGEEWEYYPTAKGKKPQPKLNLFWRDDKILGVMKTWYPSGQIESQREILDNKKQGSAFAWYKNGDLMLHEEYENDLLIKGAYYKKSDKTAVSKIDAGKGIAQIYNADGIFLRKISYDKGLPQLN